MRMSKQARPVLRVASTARQQHAAGRVLPSIGGCITATYNNGKICADFPILGQECVSIPGLPSGSGSAKVCVTYEFPASAKICAYVGGTELGCVTVGV